MKEFDGNPEETTQLNILKDIPLEILMTGIINNLSLQDLKQLAQVDQFMNQIVSDNIFWKKQIDTYFPYLKECRPKEYKEEALKLFKTEYYARCFVECLNYRISSNEWLKILSGDIEFIKNLNSDATFNYPLRGPEVNRRNQLLTFAAKEGSQEAFVELVKMNANPKLVELGFFSRYIQTNQRRKLNTLLDQMTDEDRRVECKKQLDTILFQFHGEGWIENQSFTRLEQLELLLTLDNNQLTKEDIGEQKYSFEKREAQQGIYTPLTRDVIKMLNHYRDLYPSERKGPKLS